MLTLNLTGTEAVALATVLYNVGGHPLGPRVAIDTILDALDEAGIEPNEALLDSQFQNKIYFVDDTGKNLDREVFEITQEVLTTVKEGN